MNESVDDFKQGGCLFKPTSGHPSTHGHIIMHLTGLRKQVDILISKNQALQIFYLKHRVYNETT